MFDTIAGLPLHPLIIHVVVVIGPLTALLAIAYAVRPIWRRPLRWPLVAGAVVTAISALVATESGEALLVRVATKGTAITTAFTEHQAAGEMARNSAAALLLLVLMATLSVLIPAPPARSGEGRTQTPPVMQGAQRVYSILLVIVGLFALYSFIKAGHSGASVAWSSLVN